MYNSVTDTFIPVHEGVHTVWGRRGAILSDVDNPQGAEWKVERVRNLMYFLYFVSFNFYMMFNIVFN